MSVVKLKHNKGVLIINDTLIFNGTYFCKSAKFTPSERILYSQIKIGDTLITSENTRDSLILKKDGKQITFYTFPLINEKLN